MTQRLFTLIALALLVFVSGCATVQTPPRSAELVISNDPRPLSQPGVNAPSNESADARDARDAALARDEVDGLRSVQLGSGSFINEVAAARVPPGAGEAGEVTFNFEGESLHAVVKAILGDFLQQNYVIAPGVQGTVTFSTASALRGDQALSILEMLLRWNNATMVWQDGRYTILPVAQAVPGNLTPRTGSSRNARGYEVRAIPLQYISALEMEKLIKPYAKPEAVLNVDPARNMIVLAGTAAELNNYMQTIEVFDVDWLSGMSVGVFPLEQAEAAKVVTELEGIFGEGSDTPMAGMFRFLPLEGINAILVITPQPKYLAQIETWMERLDLGGSQASLRLYVYDVKNVKATDLAATLSDIFGGGSYQAPASSSGGSIAPGLEPVSISTVGSDGRTDPTPGLSGGGSNDRGNNRSGNSRRGTAGGGDGSGPAGSSGPVVDAAGGIALGPEEDVRVSAVEDSNALLVKATSSQWEAIRRVIERLDQIPLQVQIETQIVRVLLTDELRYGVQSYFEEGIAGIGGTGSGGGIGGGGGGSDGGTGPTPANLRELAASRNSFSSLGGSIASGALNWTFVGDNVVALLNAIDEISEVSVLSAPSLVVLNNKTASINVGTQIPVTSATFNNPIGGGGNNFNTSYVQFRQIGLTLNVTPRVNPGGLVFMEVEQDESDPGSESLSAGDNIAVNNRTISTEVAVQSGQTVILGGLIKQTDSNSSGGFPFLHRIPILGALFGGKNRSSNRDELLVMITPRVISNPSDHRDLTEEYKRRFRGLEPLRVINETPNQSAVEGGQ